MRTGMGNLLETDSDVASISDGEKERTDGDGMESETMLDVNKNTSTSPHNNDAEKSTKEPDKTAVDDNIAPLSVDSNKNASCSSSTYNSILDPLAGGLATINSLPKENQVSSTTCGSKHAISAVVGRGTLKIFSPRELPPRSQLIQLKPTMCKPKLNSRNSMESLSEGLNKQKNPRFIPYEPYRGAVRPMISQDETTKKHSRNASEASVASTSNLEQVIGSLSLNESSLEESSACSLAGSANENTQHKSLQKRQPPTNVTKVVDAQHSKQGKVIEKQTHALTLLKERLKIAEKDNDDLHKENIRLKKLLVDSLSGDILQSRTDGNFDHANGISTSTSESVDTLSNEIEVWRSKFLSSCVLVEQLTRENGTLTESVGAAASILKDIKLSSSLAPTHYEQVNAWLRATRSTSTVSFENNIADES